MTLDCQRAVHREIAALFTAAGCKNQAERQALADELIGPGPLTLARARLLIERVRLAANEPKEHTP